MVQGCPCTKQTIWTEDQCLVTSSSGIRDQDTSVAEIVVRELEKTKLDVQVGMCTGSPALVTKGGESGVSWTLLVAEVWEGCWKQHLRRERVQVGFPQV